MSDPHHDELLLNRYVDGELIAGERSALELRLEEDAGLRKRLAELTELMKALDVGLGLGLGVIEPPEAPATPASRSRDRMGPVADLASGSLDRGLFVWMRRYPMFAALAMLLCAVAGMGIVLAIRGS
jgi:anti-sigma factor RsiW